MVLLLFVLLAIVAILLFVRRLASCLITPLIYLALGCGIVGVGFLLYWFR